MLSHPKPDKPIDHLKRIQTLYSYVGHPPSGYGSPDNLVIDTILRSRKYLHGEPHYMPDFRERYMDEEVNGVCDQNHLQECIQHFIDKKGSQLGAAVRELESKVLTKTYEDLAAGRQTYCWLKRANVPGPLALRETIAAMEHNLELKIPNNMFALLKMTTKFLQLPRIKINYHVKFIKLGSKEKNKLLQRKIYVKIPHKYVEMKQDDVLKSLCTLSTMTKTKERSKEERRAIVSPNMLARIFIIVTEWFSEIICKLCENSAYPQGPQEKKQAIYNLFHSMAGPKESLEVTGDNTKWNEALSPNSVMKILKSIYVAYSETQILTEIFDIVDYIFLNKLAKLNQGIPMKDENGQSFHITIDVMHLYPTHYTEEETVYLQSIYDKENNTLEARGGMFMGMLNGGSTVLAMVGFEMIKTPHIALIQSSDDFVVMATGPSRWELLDLFFDSMKRLGINVSKKKSIVLEPAGISEFNQMIRFGNYVLNCATELPSATLSGRNPYVDLAMGLKTIMEGVNKESYTPATATLQIRIFLSKYRRQYFCIPDPTALPYKRSRYLHNRMAEGLDLTRYLMYHGGQIRHSYTTALFTEIEIGLATETLDEEYLKRIHPKDNPFILGEMASYAFDLDTKKFSLSEEEMDRSVLSYTFSRNRSYLNSDMDKKLKKVASEVLEDDKARRQVDNLCKYVIPDLALGRSAGSSRLWDVVKTRLALSIADAPENEKEELRILFEQVFGVN